MPEPCIPLPVGALFADGGQLMGQGNRIRLVVLPPSLLSPALAGADVHVEGLRQLCCRASQRQVQQLCGQGDHVPMGLASEAIVIGFVELHGRGLVCVKGAATHAVLSNGQPVALSCLPYGNGSLDGFKQVHKHLLSENRNVHGDPLALRWFCPATNAPYRRSYSIRSCWVKVGKRLFSSWVRRPFAQSQYRFSRVRSPAMFSAFSTSKLRSLCLGL